ncbi:3-phosphoshikimate 1-carboxyvinyltransferase [Fischerella thermalis]|jgi:3-phosphoshikimate 1-carboxyvinyltransferase|uniref:3-phosphoshikimate 1-carboxyvinyltransferase n=1 Tax=Fischerella thermalis JSC-11 TaxID=741277 RepID=G6FVL3_9CYAN|nr:3-phosphoshikimate 1-carboxyvinyltransferase [Fischerella thermalis]PMB08369.1 3-phosphoshikimate 1-carboxyvinyltransferase [Fischerella thermalis CCMEE 5328]EHC12268.1 3-phosphoshikimate 1-carboxyvinyltransferase [Fischerella thermalis JSC-11]PLZ05054.1 3-phosphoshikimate 1-carboxyvinyltransferase [Fischerella thermalis WC119]PLZ08453.1 3-phosphoshikimate 1-carboxyvinyltransferase [Fischerella thermalis WC1110]PLZ12368.1 3-phosphoshikimate 1-carboxyvinyltransferase [Fischerella thermalis W
MSHSVITVETQENVSQKLFIQPPTSGLSLQGRIRIPGDKSISHRALMLGAIAQGQTQIKGLLLGEDPCSTASCFQAMGAEISELNSELVTVTGIGLGNLQEPTDVLNAGNSGTTMRLMLGLLASHPGRFFTVTGDSSLRTRPMSRVVKPLQQMGAQIWGRKDGSLAPLAISGQALKPIHYHSPIASAQVKSCILLAGLLTEGQTTVTEPALSRDHSERMLKAFGAKLDIDPQTHSVTITGPTQLVGQTVVVPGDISSAAFWLVAGAIVPNSELVIENVGVNPTRTGILEALAMMGADIQRLNEREVAGEPVADLRVRSSRLQSCTIAGEIIPRLIDEIPILSVASVFATGTTVIKDAAELRVKESDRIAVMAQQLNKMGAKVTELPDGMEITGGTPLVGTDVDSYTDHRIAMSLAIAALVATGKTTIQRAEAASISYPNFVPTLETVISQ